jgi:uncharacterized membrane protein
MRRLAEFTRTTLVGGLLVVLPLYLSFLLLAKTLKGALGLLAPITAELPASVELRQVVAALILAGVCFVAGLLVRTGPGLRAKNALERSLLEKIPGYSLLRGLAGRVAGRDDDEAFAPALVEIEDALAPAFVVEELADGRCAVFVPSVPTPAAGALYILPRERVHLVDVPLGQMLGVFSRWGAGSEALVEAMGGGGAARREALSASAISGRRPHDREGREEGRP